MRRVVCLLFGFVALAYAQSYYTPTIVDIHNNTTSNHAGSASTVSAQLTNSTPAGAAEMVFAYCSTTSRTLAVSDTVQTFTNVVSNAAGGTGVWSFWITYSGTVGNGTSTITVSGGTCGDLDIFKADFTYLAGTGAGTGGVDQSSAPGQSGTTSTSKTLSINYEVIIGILAGGNGNANDTATSPWTLLNSNATGGANPAWEYQIITTGGSYATAFGSGGGTVTAAILTFEATSKGGGAVCPPTIALLGVGCK
jgi:hypothetical protein